MIWDGAGEFKEVMVGVGCEKMLVFGEISLLLFRRFERNQPFLTAFRESWCGGGRCY
jgi:hypothetical protein